MNSMTFLFSILALFLFVLAGLIFKRALSAEPRDKARFIRAGVGAMAAAAGNILMIKNAPAGMLFFLMGAILVLTGRKSII
jgi:hypothetical protein